MKVLVTGAKGFVGQNLLHTLDRNEAYEVYEYDKENTTEDLRRYTADCEFVIHLAGINRPQNPSEFYEGNKGFTETLCAYLKEANNTCPILISSSIQVGKDNDYAKSKKEGEELLVRFGHEEGNPVYIYRFANLFGKWCRPNYNSVTATWCYNIAHHLEIQVNNPNVILPLCYIDDVVMEIIQCIEGHPNFDDEHGYYSVQPIYEVSLGTLRDLLYSFKESRKDLSIADQSNAFTRKLYATYLSYLPQNEFSYPLKMNCDERGSFTEFIRTQEHGQVSINVAKPGITKGNHWHHTKNEKFLVVSGTGMIQFRDVRDKEGEHIITYQVSQEKMEVIDIPTGYTHNIINTGECDMVTVMWANEPFDPERPDTYYEKVVKEDA